MALKTRQPTGMVPPPVILVEGETASWRSATVALLSRSERVGRMLWMELGAEGTADHYGAIPRTQYEIMEPDNTNRVWDWHAIMQATRDARSEAARARDAGELPVAHVVDQVGAIWDMQGEWADNRARNTRANREALASNPNHEYIIPPPFWTDAGNRWKQLQTLWLTFPGIVVLISDGSEVTLFENERPTQKKDWKVAGHKSFTRSVPIWVRLFKDRNPQLIKLRKVFDGVQAGVDRPQPLPPKGEFNLEWLIFERYGWNPAASGARNMVPMVAGDEAPESPRCAAFLVGVETAEDQAALARIWPHVVKAVGDGEITEAEGQKIRTALADAKAEMDAAATAATPVGDRPPGSPEPNGRGPSEKQHKHMHALWREIGLGGDEHRWDRLTQTSLIVGRDVNSSKELAPPEADKVIDALTRQAKERNETVGATA